MRRTGCAALAALVLPLAGCGGGDSQSLSESEFRKQANAICTAGDAELKAKGTQKLYGPDGKATPTPEMIAAYLTEDALPVARTKLDGIDKLKPPEKDRKKVDRMLAAGRQGVAQVDAQLRQDPRAYLSATSPDPFQEFNKLADDLGLHDCTSRP
jgi:hypothetical protein